MISMNATNGCLKSNGICCGQRMEWGRRFSGRQILCPACIASLSRPPEAAA